MEPGVLSNLIPAGKAMDDAKLQKYKTVLCQRMLRSGTCRYGLQCDFAHDKLELRRNLQQHWYYGQKCMKENCEDTECRYAHNDMELLYHPHVFKTQMCHSMAFGPCLKKHYCPFAHSPEELRQGKLDTDDDGESSRLFFSNFSSENKTATSSNPEGSGPYLGNGTHAAPTGEFREVTDRLKVRLLNLVDEIASVHFDQARTQHKVHNLEHLSQLELEYFASMPPNDLDAMTSQCHAVLDLITRAKEQQKREEEELSAQVKICD